MPKLLCQCGYVHDLTPIPDAGFIIIKDYDYEQLIQSELDLSKLETERFKQDSLISHINQLQERLYKCPECKEIQWVKKDGTIEQYNYRAKE